LTVVQKIDYNYLKRKVMIPKKILNRKESLKLENTLITGPKRVGKTFLIFNFLKNFKGKYKYIDFKDYKEKDFNFKNCDLVIFENYDFSIPIPNKPTFITSNKNISIKGFKKIELRALDFEEFFAFDNTLSINASFDKFLRLGNFPRIINEEYFNNEYLKETFELLEYDKKILKMFLANIGEKFTLYQIFQILKRDFKISKDRFYSVVKELIEDRVIFEVEKFNSPKSPKKFFSYNFAFKNILTNRKNIQYTFENIIFLELKEKVYYKEGVTFYMPEKKEAILVSPFANNETITEKLSKIKDIKKLTIITISNEFEIKYKKFKVEVMPFIQWKFAE